MPQSLRWNIAIAAGVGLSALALIAAVQGGVRRTSPQRGFDAVIDDNGQRMMREGRRTFRFDTFGDEAFWGGALQLHRSIAGEKNGGVGPGVSPKTALAVGLKVDLDALPPTLQQQLKAGQVNLDDPATTLALLKLNAVVGVSGVFDTDGNIRSIGITCAFCHSTVDDALAPGIGHRLDGWANRDLNVGAIVSLAPTLQPFTDLLGVDAPTVKQVLASWGPGRFDAELDKDGKAMAPRRQAGRYPDPARVRPRRRQPPHLDRIRVGAVLERLCGSDPRCTARVHSGTRGSMMSSSTRWRPKAARETPAESRITAKPAALHFYQLSIPAPKAPAGSFDPAGFARGKILFEGPARCATCHVPPLFTEPGNNLHAPSEVGVDAFQADRSPTHMYRTAPLAGLWAHQKGGFYHDGRFTTLLDVVNHYDSLFSLGLTDQQKKDLVEYLKGI